MLAADKLGKVKPNSAAAIRSTDECLLRNANKEVSEFIVKEGC